MCKSQPAPTCIFHQRALEALLGSRVLLLPGAAAEVRERGRLCMRNELLQHWGNWGARVLTVVGNRKKMLLTEVPDGLDGF